MAGSERLVGDDDASDKVSASAGETQPNGGERRGLPPALLLLLGLAAVVIILLGMRVAAALIVPLLLALVITLAVSPLIDFLTRHRLPRWLAYVVTVIVTFAAIAFVVTLGFSGVARLIAAIPQYRGQYAGRMQDLRGSLGGLGGHLSATTQGQGILGRPGSPASPRTSCAISNARSSSPP